MGFSGILGFACDKHSPTKPCSFLPCCKAKRTQLFQTFRTGVARVPFAQPLFVRWAKAQRLEGLV